jgi:aspartyl-tRNA(Asn)/glutamyl-tRNA(Gln) amidotransferase subunit B
LAKDISLPELPQAKRARFETEYGFSKADAHILTSDPEWGIFTENVMSELVEWLHCLPESKEDTEEMHLNKKQQLAKLTGGWLTSKLMGMMAERKIDIRLLRVKEENFAELMALIYTNRVNSTNAQKILIEMLDSGVDMDPTHIMEAKGYGQISDEGKLGSVADDIIKSYPEQVAQFKAGKEPLIKFLVGMLMKATEGSADPQVAEKLLREKMK